MQVEIWSDVVCPWCYIGKRRFEKALAIFTERHPDAEVNVAYRAFQLDPTAPAESEPVMQAYEKKFGGPDAARQIIERVTGEAAGEGLEFRMDIAQRANTLGAHRLLVLAEQEGVQHELKERLMAAYFTEGEPIGESEVLVRLATEVGLDEEVARAWLLGDAGRNEVASHLEFAAAAGVSSVPTFVFDRAAGVPGAQPPEALVDVLEQMYARAAGHADATVEADAT